MGFLCFCTVDLEHATHTHSDMGQWVWTMEGPGRANCLTVIKPALALCGPAWFSMFYWIQKVSIRNSVNVCSEHMNWIKVNWTLVRELSQTGARELQCKQLQSNMPTCVQNSLNTNCPNSAAANQAVTLTRMTNECVVQLGRLLAGQFSSAQLICCVQAFIISRTTTESPLLQQRASVMERLEVKGEYYQNCSMLCCVWQLCTSVCAKMWAVIKFMFS